MALRSIYSQLLFDGESLVKVENGETSGQKEKPSKVTIEDETQYCFKNTKPTLKEQYLGPFTPNSEQNSAEIQTPNFILQSLRELDVTANEPITIPRSFPMQEMASEGKFLVAYFSPNDTQVSWHTQTGCNNSVSTSYTLTGPYWIVMKRFGGGAVTFDASTLYDRQPMILAVTAPITNSVKNLTITTSGRIYWFALKGETPKTYRVNFSCGGIDDFIPVLDARTIRYVDIDSMFNSLRMNRNLKLRKNIRTIISETQDGFWKQSTQNFTIKLKIDVEAWGVMGGTFGNWLIDSGFKTVENQYNYQRNGESVNAITVTTPYPTKKAGDSPQYIGPIYFNGQAMVLSSGDILTVWYTEENWILANSIYAKDFFSDANIEFELTAQSNEIIFRQNKPGSLGYIENNPGTAKLKYVAGGFGQLDTTSYTGLAVYFKFKVINPEYPIQNVIEVQKTDPFYNAFASIGHLPYEDHGDHVDVYFNGTLVHQGYMSAYPRKSFEFDISLTYTALIPSDPDFITGGSDYQETITKEVFDSLNDLKNTVNEMIASNNISDIVGGITTFMSLANSFPQLIDGIIDVTKKIFTKFKSIKSTSKRFFKRIIFKKKITINNETVDISTPTFFSSTLKNKRLQKFDNMLSDDEMFATLHNIAVSAKKSKLERVTFGSAKLESINLDPTVTARIAMATPPVVAVKESIPSRILKALSESLPGIEESSIIEFNQISNTISTLSKNFKSIKTFAVQPELIDYYIQNLGSNYARSLFSLNLRKQLSKFIHMSDKRSPTYQNVLDLMLNDRELINVFNDLSPDTIKSMFGELVKIIENALVD